MAAGRDTMPSIALIVLVGVSLSPTLVSVDPWLSMNEVVWESESIVVENLSVIPIPEWCPDKARLQFASNTDKEVITNQVGFWFSASKWYRQSHQQLHLLQSDHFW